jgi:hypothetical protein
MVTPIQRAQYNDPVADFLKTLGYEYLAVWEGEKKEKQSEGRPWVHDRWGITFVKRRDTFETVFRTGTGNRKPDPMSRGKPGDWQYRPPRPERPKAGVVLDILIKEAEYGDMSFSQFCDELGYDYNSREHESIYHRCMDIGRELRQFFGADLTKIKDVIEGYEPE